MTCQEESITEFINKDNQGINKFSSKKNIKGINKNINPQKYKGSYKIKQKKSMANENINNNTNNNFNPSNSTSNNNNNTTSEINLEDNLMTNNKSPKLSKNNINLNNSANKYIILNKNKRNMHNINCNNEEIINNNSLNNYINSNSYSTADKNSFIHITNSNVTKMKNKMINNNSNNNQKNPNQNYIIHPKKLFPSGINNGKSMANNNKNSINIKNDNSSNNSLNKISSSNSNKNIYNDINSSSNISNISKNINSDKKVNIYLYNNNNDNNNKKINDNISSNKSPEIIKKYSTTMKNKNNGQNNNTNNNVNINNNRNSINGNQLIFHPTNNNNNNVNNITNHIYNIKKIENKKLSNKISNKVLKKNNNINKNNNKINNNINNNNSNNNNNNNNNNNINSINNNNKLEDTFIDGQIPTVADENPNVNSLKIMKYNKCTYTNQIISQKLTKILSTDKINNLIFSFLTGDDLYNLSLLNHFFNEITTSSIHKIIIKKIINNKGKTIKSIWEELLNKSMLYNNNHTDNEIYLNYLNYSNKYDEEITKDLSRTLPNNALFKKKSNNYIKLFNVLKAYSNYNKKIGYAQGMNFIVAKLIIFSNSEKECFLKLDAIFSKLNFSEVVGISNGLEQKMFIIQFLLKKYCPKIITFLEEKKINHEIFTASWIITLFTKNFENDKLLYIVWNFSIIFGWKFIYLFTISIINEFQKKYINLELYEFTQFMKKIFKSSEFEENFHSIIEKTFEYMKHWKKINKELEKDLEVYKMKTDTESATEIIIDSFDEDTIIQ